MAATLQSLPLSLIQPSQHNARRISKKDPQFQQLVASIRLYGIQSPPKVVPKGSGQFETVYGHRRLAAAQEVGLEDVEVLVDDVDQNAADVLRVVENLHRADLAPLEEAEQISKLLSAERTYADIAAMLGRSETWVARRTKLLDLSPQWRQFLRGKSSLTSDLDPNAFTAAHLESIARLSAEAQDRLITILPDALPWDSDTIVSKSRLDEIIEESLLLSLDNVPWDLDDAGLADKPACANCPHRANAQTLLFSDLDAKSGTNRCMLAECFSAKREAFATRQRNETRAKHGADVLFVTPDRYGNNSAAGTIGYSSYTKCRKSDPGAVKAVTVKNDLVGAVQYVTLAGTSSATTGQPLTNEERMTRITKRRARAMLEALAQQLPERHCDHTLPEAAALVAAFGTSVGDLTGYGRWDTSALSHHPLIDAGPLGDRTSLADILATATNDPLGSLLTHVRRNFASRALTASKHEPTYDEVRHLCQLLHQPTWYDDLYAEAKVAHPLSKVLQGVFDEDGKSIEQAA